jgi:tetratricopeptide (TPR) repeat protein
MSRKTRKPGVGAPAVSVAAARDTAKFWKPSWLFAGALAAALVAFGPALHGPFVFDDVHLPFADPKAAQMPAGFWIGGVRPVLMMTYWMNFLLSGTDPFSYHFVNLVLHAATSVLMFSILECQLTISGAVRNAKAWALAGAAIFLLHPLQTESVDYIASRSEVLSGLFFCAAWLVFLRNFGQPTGLATSVKILLLGGGAILAKENAICLPAILFATDLYWAKRPFAAQMRGRLNLYLPFLFGGLLAGTAILRSLSGDTAAGFSAGISPLQYALTECRAILIYVSLFFFPIGQNGDWHLSLFHSFSDNLAWLYVFALAGLIAAVPLLYSRMRLASYGLAIFLLMLAPTSSLVPVVDVLAERRMYLPIAGLIIGSIAFLVHLRLNPGGLRVIATTPVLIAAALCCQRSSVWASPEAFWADSVRQNGLNPRAHFGLGTALLVRNDCGAAVRELVLARSEDQSNQEIQWNLADAYRCNHQPELALALYHSLAGVHPSADAWNQVAFTEAQLGHSDEVTAALANALRLDPNNAVSYAYLGLTRLAVNNPQAAQEDFQHALQLDPNNQVALEGMQRVAKLRGR